MANKQISAGAPAEPIAEKAIPLSLSEFCSRLSETDKRVELIGGFESSEIRAGRLSDTAEQYAVRYQAFITKPA